VTRGWGVWVGTQKVTPCARCTSRKEDSHNGITLSWDTTLWGSLRRITIKSEEHVTISTGISIFSWKFAKVRVNLFYVSNVSRHIFIHFQCALTRFKCGRCIKRGLGTFERDPSFDLILTVYTKSQTLVVSRRTHCAHRQLGHTVFVIQYFRPSSEHPVTVFRYGGVSPLMFLASWLDRRSANGRESAPLFTSFQVPTDGAERRCPSSRGRATHKDDPGQPAGTNFVSILQT